MSPKSKSITEGIVDLSFLSLVQSKIEFVVNLGIGSLVIYCWWNSLVLTCQNCGNRLNCPGRAQQMTCHGFCGADIQFVSVVTENVLDGQ